MTDIERIQEQIQMLHERLELVEQSVAQQNQVKLLQIQNDILNIKTLLKELWTENK